MIHVYSRYYVGTRAQDSGTMFTFRNKTLEEAQFFAYIWKESDRIDTVAAKFLGDPQIWWKITDINEHIQDPWNITPGVGIRIPRNV
jgi:hypothetical protein